MQRTAREQHHAAMCRTVRPKVSLIQHRWPLVALVGLVLSGQAAAQVVSVSCCISEGNLTRIGECLSGPENDTFPPGCGSIVTCVLGFGGDTAIMDVMCDPARPELPDEPRAVCKSWTATEAQVTQECIAVPNTDFNLFEMYDADGDGDMDLRDAAAFQKIYQSVPKEVQSEARLVYVECCVPAGGGADTTPTCTLGFDGVIEPGDYMYELCVPGSFPTPHTPGLLCESWSVGYVPAMYLCEGADVCDDRCTAESDGESEGMGCLAAFGARGEPSEAEAGK